MEGASSGEVKVQPRQPKVPKSKPKVPPSQPKVQAKLLPGNVPLSPPVQDSQRQYTFGDVFCGAGGMSCGAMMAGLRLKWVFDNNEQAITAFRKNFSEKQIASYTLDYEDFISLLPEYWTRFKVDIIHFSPPCQPFSQQTLGRRSKKPETIKRHEEERKCLDAIIPISELLKPRIAVLETVPGILAKENIKFFRQIVFSFKSLGYRLRWKKVNCAQVGLAQSRPRVFVIASQ